jgi:Ca-activated chloride channel homolog
MSIRVKIPLLLASALLGGSLLRLQATTSDGKPTDNKPTFRVGVDTVFVNVAVTDSLDRSVVGLEKDNFKIYDDKVEQKITHFVQQAAPISVGILFDVSGSMKTDNNINAARSAIIRFLQTANPEDEFFLIAFNQSPTLVTGFTDETASIQNAILLRNPGGRTAVYDAVYMGLDQMKTAKHDKKALILTSDGEDNSSRYTVSEVREFARESSVQIYGIGEQGRLGYGGDEIRNLVAMSGGRAFFPDNFNELDYYIDLIHSELRNEYVVGYVPTGIPHDGKWRRIRIKMEVPGAFPGWSSGPRKATTPRKTDRRGQAGSHIPGQRVSLYPVGTASGRGFVQMQVPRDPSRITSSLQSPQMFDFPNLTE